MADPFLGEIKAVGFDFAPRQWAKCAGQFLDIAQNAALFSLLGTMYGGDGRINFKLPDLRGRSLIGEGQGSGLTNRIQGQFGGRERVALSLAELPTHNHGGSISGSSTGTFKLNASTNTADVSDPTNAILAKATIDDGGRPIPFDLYTASTSQNTQMAQNTIDVDLSSSAVTVNNNGQSQPFDNMTPWLAINYIIALQGLFPSRS